MGEKVWKNLVSLGLNFSSKFLSISGLTCLYSSDAFFGGLVSFSFNNFSYFLKVNISHSFSYVVLCLLPFEPLEPFLHESVNLIQFSLPMGNETLKKRTKCFLIISYPG